MATNRVAHRSVRSAQHSHQAPTTGQVSARKAARMQRAKETAQIEVVTRGKHPKIAKKPGPARALRLLAKLDLLLPAAAERVKLLIDNPSAAPVKPDPVSLCRTAAFAAEAYMRLGREHLGDAYEKHFTRVKELEDRLGRLGYCLDMLQKPAAKVGADDIINYWTFQVSKAAELAATCLDDRWLPRKGEKTESQKLAQVVLDTDWPEGKDDRKLNAGALAWEADRVVEAELDMHVLDEMHSLRRKCRWFSILASAMNGAVVLTDDNTPKKYRDMVNDPAADNDFSKLPISADEKHPLELSRGMFIAMSKIIDAVGSLKDNREQLDAIVEALRAVRGMSAKDAEAEGLRLLGHPPDAVATWIGQAQAIEPQAKELFHHIAKQMRRQE
jgi:hypothetical protein